ncbi:MAG: hypothetical protein HY360_23425 [Verrucomicrobia bacterium]|nr:hypothetical protein [Verrucomicrobiota bacterium]
MKKKFRTSEVIKMVLLLAGALGLLAGVRAGPIEELISDDTAAWHITIHGDQSKAKLSELRLDSADKIAGQGSVAYDVSGESSPNLWLSLHGKLLDIVDLTYHEMVFSYKITAKNLTSEKGLPKISLRVGVSSSDQKSYAAFSGEYVADGEWHEVRVNNNLLKPQSPQTGEPTDWDLTNARYISIDQMLHGLKDISFTVRIDALRLEKN